LMTKQSPLQRAKKKAVEKKAKEEAIEKKVKEKAIKKKAKEEVVKKKAKEKAVKKKAKEKAVKKKAKEKAIEKKAKEEAIEKLDPSSSIVNPGTKKRTASTHEPSDRPQKARKRTASARVDKGAEGVGTQFHRTLATKRMASHSGLMEQGTTIYAPDMETQIAGEACGVMRKNIPWDTFRSTYLCDFNVEAQSKLAVESVKKIGDGNWEEKLFWKRLGEVLSAKVRSGCAFICLSVLC
jgi:hypothetical protein